MSTDLVPVGQRSLATTHSSTWLLSFAYYTTFPAMHLYYNINYLHEERLEAVRDRGFFLLPNHQSKLDIVFEGLLLKRTLKRFAYYIMLDTLGFAPLFKRLRGIEVKQGFYVKRDATDRESKKRLLEEAKRKRERVENTMAYLLAQEEALVVHIQGGRYYKQPFEVNKPNLSRLLKIQKQLGKQIPFVPLTIYYEAKFTPRSPVVVDVGNPLCVSDGGLEDLAAHLHREINTAYSHAERMVGPPWPRSVR